MHKVVVLYFIQVILLQNMMAAFINQVINKIYLGFDHKNPFYYFPFQHRQDLTSVQLRNKISSIFF
jgi:hypothetical protein